MKSNYADFVLKNAPRVITQIDRDPNSKTYGSCDRNFWHLKTRDFSSAILQQSGLVLALLYSNDFEGNVYYKNENIKEWAVATVYYWAKVQLKDGSFNEYYPHEHGFPPTAFSLFSACEIYKKLKLKDEMLVSKMAKTAHYLVEHIEENAFNQEMASMAALYSFYTIVKKEWVKEGCERKLKRILAMQKKEGWFPEYGGADIGYLSVTLDMLAAYYSMSGDEAVVEPINQIIGFIKYFVHPDATAGGEYGARNTTYCLPFGFQAAISWKNQDAAAIKQALYGAYDWHRNFYFMDSVDDRYFSHYLLHSFLRALEIEQAQEVEPAVLPCFENHYKYFEESGLISCTNENYHSIISLQKGGIIKVWKGKKEIMLDCGYRVDFGGGCVAAMNWLDPSYSIHVEKASVSVAGYMNRVTLKMPSPILHMGLRVISFLLGNKIIGFLKRKLIFVDQHCDIRFTRKIIWKEKQILIEDEFESDQEYRLIHATNMSLRHVASGKFFGKSDLLDRKNKDIPRAKKVIVKTELDIAAERATYQNEKLV